VASGEGRVATAGRVESAVSVAVTRSLWVTHDPAITDSVLTGSAGTASSGICPSPEDGGRESRGRSTTPTSGYGGSPGGSRITRSR
jgi:hypothetical protein